jgi:hypothetical protein
MQIAESVGGTEHGVPTSNHRLGRFFLSEEEAIDGDQGEEDGLGQGLMNNENVGVSILSSHWLRSTK